MRILLIEDSETEALRLRATLSEIPDLRYELEREPRLSSGLARLERGGVDLVLLDLGLPDSIGIGTFSRLREKYPSVPVIVLTSLDEEEVGLAAVGMGVQDDVVKKHVEAGLLSRAMACAVERQRIVAELAATVSELGDKVRDQATVLESTRDAIVITDLDGRVTFWNAGAAGLFGWSSDDVVGRSAVFLYPPEARVTYRTVHDVVIAEGEWMGELQIRTRDGVDLVVWSHWTVLGDGDGRPRRVLSVNSDLTERRKMEIQLRQAQRLDSLGVLAGGVAHDFNNVLTMIVGYADMIGTLVGHDHQATHYVELIQQASSHATDLIRRILTFSRTGETDPTPIRVDTVVEEVVSLIGSSVPSSVEVRTRIARDLPLVHADAVQIHQAVMNLCSNAVQAIEGPGRVEIQVERVDVDTVLASTSVDLTTGEYVRISVRDDGAGMSEATLERIFEPFFSTKKPGRGTGLGLPVIQGIVKNHRGAITVNSECGLGTAFHIYLPVESARESREAPGRHGEGVPGRVRVLLVADDGALLGDLAGALDDLGYAVSAYSDPLDALDQFRQDPSRFDVAFIDGVMRPMTGFELTGAMRPTRPELPVILLAADPSPSHAMAGLGAATQIVRKTVSAPNLAIELHTSYLSGTDLTSPPSAVRQE